MVEAIGSTNCGSGLSRGGSWADIPEMVRSAVRVRDQTHWLDDITGFRLARIVNSPGGEIKMPRLNSVSVRFTRVPMIGRSDDLEGLVVGAKSPEYFIVVYVLVDGGWWVKPYATKVLTNIAGDGKWMADITTGGNDLMATRIAAFVVPSDYNPPVLLGVNKLPEELAVKSVASFYVDRSLDKK